MHLGDLVFRQVTKASKDDDGVVSGVEDDLRALEIVDFMAE